MPSIFTKIIAGEIPCYKIAEDANFIAILDVFPLVKGHVLVIPKLEVDYLFDVPDNLLVKALVFAKPIAKAIQLAIPCSRIGITVIGLEVPHAHIHLVPINSADDVNFTKPKLKLTDNELAEVQLQILKYL